MTVALTDRKKKNPLINNKWNAPLAKMYQIEEEEEKQQKTVSQHLN